MKIVEIMTQLTNVVPLKKFSPLPKEGPIFSPPKLEAMSQVLMKTDKFSTFKPNYDLRSGDKLRTVQKYIGTGVIVNPCDFSVVPDLEWILVASTTHGIFKFQMSGTLIGHFLPENKGQIAGVDYCQSNQTIIATILESFCEWKLLVMDTEFQIKDTIVCPSEPKIAISWNRYCTMLDPTHVLLTTGDNNLL